MVGKRGHVACRDTVRVFEDPAGGRLHALGPVELDIEPGAFVSLVGPSGCGKSTLLRLVSGLELPTSGEVLVDGQTVVGPHHTRGMVFQDPTLFPWMTVRKNIAASYVARGLPRAERNQVDEYIRLVGLEGFENAYPHQLSGGMAQRASLARALAAHPSVLLLDEPLGALDAFTRMAMQDEILRIWQARSTTMILVTHDIDEAIYMSDRILIMTKRPGVIQTTIHIDLDRPRNRSHPRFLSLRGHILETLHFAQSERVLEYYL